MLPRHDHILCCVDDSEPSRAAFAEAARLREELGAARLSVLYVRAPGLNLGVYIAPSTEEIDPSDEEWLVQLTQKVPGATPVLLDGLMTHPPVEAVCWAEQNDVDLIVAGTRRGPIVHTLLGSFAAYLARHAPCPVMLIPPGLSVRLPETVRVAGADPIPGLS
jgi:nucleotide-binding universal stress UspA family protein